MMILQVLGSTILSIILWTIIWGFSCLWLFGNATVNTDSADLRSVTKYEAKVAEYAKTIFVLGTIAGAVVIPLIFIFAV